MSTKAKPTAKREEATPALVPKLRFPEFQGAEGWVLKVVGDYLGESRVASLLNDPAKRITVRLHLQGVEHREHRGTESTESTNNFGRKAGQFIYGKQNIHKGAFGIVPAHLDAFETSQDLPCFDFKSCCAPLWFYYHLARENVYCGLELKMTGTGSKRLNEKTFLALSIAAPEYPEQQKVAECLSSVDELLAAQARKVDALKTHKKGLMRQLFPREGETVPRLRFSEFRGAGEWEVRRLKHLATYTKGFAFKSQDYREEGIRIIRVSDLGADFIKSDNKKIFIDVKSARVHERYRLRNEEIIITTVGSKPELINSAVGRGIRVTRPDEGLLNQNLLKLELLPGTSSMFLFCNINTELYQKFIASISRGNANQANIAVKELMDFEVAVPAFLEQQRIAECMSSLDALITAETQKLEALKTHKKGLMQQLFPTPEKN